MARYFDGSGARLNLTAAEAVTPANVTVLYYFKYRTGDSIDDGDILFSFRNNTTYGGIEVSRYALDDKLTGWVFRDFFSSYQASNIGGKLVADLTRDVWHTCIVRSRAGYGEENSLWIDGVKYTTGTADWRLETTAVLGVGSSAYGGGGYAPHEGAELTIWNTLLSDAQIADLAAGETPSLVAPANIIRRWQILGDDSPEPEDGGGTGLTVTGACPQTTHPPFAPHPTLSAASASGTEIELTLGAGGAGSTVHKLYRSTVSGFTPGAATLIATYGASPPATVNDTGLVPGTTYYYVLSANNGSEVGTADASATTGGAGDRPVVRVGAVTDDSAELSTDTLSAYLEVKFQVYEGAVAYAPAYQTGSGRFFYTQPGLSDATTYTAYVQVRYASGWSDVSEGVEFTTKATGWQDEDFLGCPPSWPGIHINPDGNPWNRLGTGFFRPLPGQPARGVLQVKFRWPTSAPRWDFYLSDDLGATWTLVAENTKAGDDADGDRLLRYLFDLDTTLWPDGQDYRLKAVDPSGTEDDVVGLSFPIDNSDEVKWWKQSYGELGERWGKLWAQNEQTDFGDPLPGGIWVHGSDGGIGALRGHDMAMLADLDVPECEGADITTRFLVWSGEGGFLQLQGRDDVEAFHVGVGLFGKGVGSENRQGLVVAVDNLIAWPAGCCSDYLTSDKAGIGALFAEYPGDSFTSTGAITSEVVIDKMWFKAMALPKWHGLTPEDLAKWPLMSWRGGPEPGDAVGWKKYTCARRWEVYTLRVRAEQDAGDNTRLRVRFRLDGPGVNAPLGGYWHGDEWLEKATPWGSGALGMVSQQIAQDIYGDPAGARVFLSWSALPLEPGDFPEPIPFPLPWWNPPEPGKPCTLILQAFDDTRQRVIWEVGTDRYHPNPYLCVPENYGEQELDIVNGAATIGQVEAVVVDRAQVVGDQDTGWMTERLGEAGVGHIHGRRFRMLRYIDYERGWVVIADGPGSSPRMDPSYSAFRWVIRDTRETERKVRAFVRSDSWLLPMGVEDGWGQYTDAEGTERWLVPPATPLVGLYNHFSYGGYTRGRVTFDEDLSLVGGDYHVTEQVLMIAAIEELATSAGTPLGDPRPVYYDYPDIEIWWRAHESGDPWTVVHPTDTVMPGEDNLLLWLPGAPTDPAGSGDEWWPERGLIAATSGFVSGGTPREVFLEDGVTPVRAAFYLMLRGYLAEGTFPDDITRIEVAVRYTGEPTEAAPKLIEGLTQGQFLKKLYDGEYSYTDPVTGDFIPTGIRYNEADLLKMTDPVRLRITESVDDGRAWAESHIYAPDGWCPALDNDGQISPVDQVPPDDFSGELLISNPVTEPVPEWGAGERIVNDLFYTYPRLYPAAPEDVASIDRLAVRDITIEYRNDDSIKRFGLFKVEYDGSAYAAIGDEYGSAVRGVTREQGWLQAQDRKLYIFDRYQWGTPIIEVPVMREHCALLRAGSWVRVNLTWFPNYQTQERHMICGAQVLAIYDVDCAWRVLLIEKVTPLEEVS